MPNKQLEINKILKFQKTPEQTCLKTKPISCQFKKLKHVKEETQATSTPLVQQTMTNRHPIEKQPLLLIQESENQPLLIAWLFFESVCIAKKNEKGFLMEDQDCEKWFWRNWKWSQTEFLTTFADI